MAVIGTIAVNIVAETSKFQAGLSSARGAMRSFADKLTSFGGIASSVFGTAFLGSALRSFGETGSELYNLSRATGVAVEQLSFLKYAAQQTNTDIDALKLGFKSLVKQGLDPNKMEHYANVLRGIENPTLRGQRALKLFGKQGLALLPMLLELGDLRRTFDDLGGPMTTETAKNAELLQRSWGDLKKVFIGVRNAIASAVAPTLIAINSHIATLARGVKPLIRDFPTVTWLLTTLGTVALALGPVLLTLKGAIWGVTTAVGALQAALKGGAIATILGFLIANPAITATLLGLAAIGYGLSFPAPGVDSETDNTGKEQVAQQRRTNDLLAQMVSKNMQVNLQPAGANE